MSLHDLVEQLVSSLQASARLLQQVQQGLEQRRTAWVSARPSAVAAPATALAPVTRALAEEEARRARLVAAAGALLALPHVAPAARHVNVSTLAAALPAPLAARLRQAAATATAVSERVRVELALGSRLLAFSRRVHEGLLGELAAELGDVGGYDRGARRVHGALVGGGAAGTLIDGRM